MASLVWAYGRHVNRSIENLAHEFRRKHYTLVPYSMVLPRRKKLAAILSTLRIKNGKVRAFSSLHPRAMKNLTLPSELENVPVFVFGDAILSSAPHFFYQDLDVDTIIRYRENGIRTYMYDEIPLGILKKRRDLQWEYYRRAQSVFAMSEWVKRSIVASGAIESERVHVVGAGSNLPTGFAKNPYSENNIKAKTLTFVGRDFHRKGGEVLLEAWPLVRSEVKDAKLLIAGPSKKGSDPNLGIEWLGSVNSRSLLDIYRKSTGFVLPSLWEPYGVAFLEAMSTGLPVIGMDYMAMPEFIRPGVNGYLLEKAEAKILADAMVQMLTDTEKTLSLSRQSHLMSENYQWPEVRRKMERVLDSELKWRHTELQNG